MTESLYRKEALEARHRSLYGEIILKTPPKTWWITLLIALTLGGIIAALFWGKIPYEDGHITLIDWLLR